MIRYVRRMLGQEKEVVRILRLAGKIQNEPGDPGPQFSPPRHISIRNLEKKINVAFECKKVKPKAVVLEINSPGGSPSQSNLIFTRIRNASEKNRIPVITFTEDLATSGGYWIACAGDEIYCDPNAIVGSIGAIYGSFGFQEAIKKLGLEWRKATAGENKFRMDPFEPITKEDQVWIENLLRDFHENFIDLVKSRRKSLDTKHKTVFTGDAFIGSSALKIGLVDGLESDIHALIKRKYGDVKVERATVPMRGLAGWMARSSGTVIDAHEILDALIERALYSKFGL